MLQSLNAHLGDIGAADHPADLIALTEHRRPLPARLIRQAAGPTMVYGRPQWNRPPE
jgi:hypothetical protein